MITLVKDEFEAVKNKRYSKLQYVKTDKNGTDYFTAMCPCDRCNGQKIVYTHVLNGKPVPATPDGGVCWKCLGSGMMSIKIKVFTPEYAEKFCIQQRARAAKRIDDFTKNVEKMRQATYDSNLQIGYKEINFTVADYVGLPTQNYKYYRVAHQTEKAYLLNLLKDLYTSDSQAVSRWVPIKAITFKEEK